MNLTIAAFGTDPYSFTVGGITGVPKLYETYDDLWRDVEKYVVGTLPGGRKYTRDLLSHYGTITVQCILTEAGRQAWGGEA